LQLEADPYHSSVIDQVEKRMSNNSVGLIARAPLGRGTLFRDQRDLNALSGSVAATPAQAAIRLAMQLNPRGTVLVGMTNRKHLRENLGALDLPAYSDRSLAILKSWQNDEVAEEVPNGPVKPI
jgi:aryl-alcohol dehydrogenase-like predicted oxidoreductase